MKKLKVICITQFEKVQTANSLLLANNFKKGQIWLILPNDNPDLDLTFLKKKNNPCQLERMLQVWKKWSYGTSRTVSKNSFCIFQSSNRHRKFSRITKLSCPNNNNADDMTWKPFHGSAGGTNKWVLNKARGMWQRSGGLESGGGETLVLTSNPICVLW